VTTAKPSRAYEQEPLYEQVVSDADFVRYQALLDSDGWEKAEEFFNSVMDKEAWQRNLVKAGKA